MLQGSKVVSYVLSAADLVGNESKMQRDVSRAFTNCLEDRHSTSNCESQIGAYTDTALSQWVIIWRDRCVLAQL